MTAKKLLMKKANKKVIGEAQVSKIERLVKHAWSCLIKRRKVVKLRDLEVIAENLWLFIESEKNVSLVNSLFLYLWIVINTPHRTIMKKSMLTPSGTMT